MWGAYLGYISHITPQPHARYISFTPGLAKNTRFSHTPIGDYP